MDRPDQGPPMWWGCQKKTFNSLELLSFDPNDFYFRVRSSFFKGLPVPMACQLEQM